MGRMITAHTALTGANTATGDLFEVVDVSVATDGPGGTNKKITRAELLLGLLQETSGVVVAELNYLDIAVLGTGAASKAVVLDSGDDYTWPATGVLTYGVLKDAAATTITATGAEINYLDITTLGTGAASKAVVLDAGDDYTWPATGVLTYGILNDGTTALAATALEVNRTCDVSTRLVSVGGTSLAVTVALHDGKIIKLDHTAAESTCTLPAAAGTGAKFTFIVSAVNTNNHIIKVTGDDTIDGTINILDNDAAAQGAYAATGTDDTLTLNGTTTGGQIGDWIEFVDLAADQWAVRGSLMVPAGSNPADPFSATVP